jgi:hypothetical protein
MLFLIPFSQNPASGTSFSGIAVRQKHADSAFWQQIEARQDFITIFLTIYNQCLNGLQENT